MTTHKSERRREGAWLTRLASVAEENAIPIYSTLAAVLFATNGLWFAYGLAWVGCCAIAAAIAFIYLSMRGSVRARRAHGKLAQAVQARDEALQALQENLADYITYLSELVFNEKLQFKQTERISVFECSGSGLILIARFSANPDYCMIRRRAFPDDSGIIAVALKSEQGEVFELKLPDPEQDWDGYIEQQHEKWKVPKSRLRGMTMRSREYAAFVVYKSSNNQASGVIVFESTQPHRLDKEALRKAVKSREVVAVGNLLGFVAFGEMPVPARQRNKV